MKESYLEITEIYRHTGKILRRHGADRVYIIQSKTLANNNDTIQMQIQVIADQLCDQEKAKKELQETFSSVDYRLYDGSHDENYKLLMEAEEDGIQI